jgi:hypothetical protein
MRLNLNMVFSKSEISTHPIPLFPPPSLGRRKKGDGVVYCVHIVFGFEKALLT